MPAEEAAAALAALGPLPLAFTEDVGAAPAAAGGVELAAEDAGEDADVDDDAALGRSDARVVGRLPELLL